MSRLGLARRMDRAGRRRRDAIERAAVGALALAATATSLWAAGGLQGVLGAALALVMLAISVIDARQFIIPNTLTATALALGLLNAGVQDWDSALAGIGA